MENSNTTKNNDCFDLDASCLSKLTFNPCLSDYVDQVHKSQQDYSATFMHWTAKQKFGINTSVRMQKVLGEDCVFKLYIHIFIQIIVSTSSYTCI